MWFALRISRAVHRVLIHSLQRCIGASVNETSEWMYSTADVFMKRAVYLGYFSRRASVVHICTDAYNHSDLGSANSTYGFKS